MSELLDRAFDKLRGLPLAQQDVIATWLMQVADDDMPAVILTSEEERVLALSLEQAARGEFVTDEAMQQLWAKHGL